MRIYKRTDSPSWWITWNDQHGKRHRRSSGTSDRKLAEGLAAKWVREGFMEEHFGKKPDLSFSQALLNYARAQKRDHTRNFMDKTRFRIKILEERFKGYQVSDFTYGAVQEYADQRLASVSSATVLRDLAIVKAAINKARREMVAGGQPVDPPSQAFKAPQPLGNSGRRKPPCSGGIEPPEAPDPFCRGYRRQTGRASGAGLERGGVEGAAYNLQGHQKRRRPDRASVQPGAHNAHGAGAQR